MGAVPAMLSCVKCACAKLDIGLCDDSDQCVGIAIIAAGDLVKSAATVQQGATAAARKD